MTTLAVNASATTTIPLYIFAGQSNMVGWAANTHELPTVDRSLVKPLPHVQFFGPHDDDARQWGPLEAPTEVKEPQYHSGFGPELSAAQALTRIHPGTDIAIVKYAHGSTNLYNQWNPETKKLYTAFIARVRYAADQLRAKTHRPVKIAGLFWMQGESDCDTTAHAKAYGGHLKMFLDYVRRDLHAPTMPAVIARINDIRYFWRGWNYSNIVRDQERRVADADRYTWMVSTDGLERSKSSAVHFTTRGEVDLGRRMVQRWFRL